MEFINAQEANAVKVEDTLDLILQLRHRLSVDRVCATERLEATKCQSQYFQGCIDTLDKIAEIVDRIT